MKNLSNPQISIYLDTRRAKANGRFPVKLRVYTPIPRTQKLYSTGYEMTADDFEKVMEGIKPRKAYKDKRLELQAIENRARSISEKLDPFTFTEFERIFTGKSKMQHDVLSLFAEVVDRKEKAGSISTSEKYNSTQKLLEGYLKHLGKKENADLPFTDLTVSFLNNLERYCTTIKKYTVATTAINMRNLRAVYREAMEKDAKLQARYPFGAANGLYTIKSGGKVNKALTQEQIQILKDCEPANESQALAKDIWFFSYLSYGMNMKDICQLKHSDIDGDRFRYVRAKTQTTRKREKINEVPLTKTLIDIINRRKDTGSKYLFGFLQEGDSPAKVTDRIRNITATVNKHFRKFAFYAGLDSTFAKQIGTYHARHSFATIARNRGHSIDLISDILHDGDIRTTQGYLESFGSKTFSDLSKDLDL